MKKTSVYLEPELDRAVALWAESQGVSKAEAIRQALRSAVEGVRRPRLTAIGIGRGPGDVAGDIDGHLAETGFGE